MEANHVVQCLPTQDECTFRVGNYFKQNALNLEFQYFALDFINSVA